MAHYNPSRTGVVVAATSLALVFSTRDARAQATTETTTTTTTHEATPAEGTAHAEPGEHEHAEHEREARFHFGFAGSVWVGLGDSGTVVRYGPGIMFAITLIPQHLELVSFVRLLGSREGITVPMDLLLEVPFHITRWFHPFIALGPTIAPTFSTEGNQFPVGGASAIGAHFYVAREYALLVEANYNLLYNNGSLEHEVGGTVGALIGF